MARGLDHQTVKSSPYAWRSFALGTDGLIARDFVPGDVRIVAFDFLPYGRLACTVEVADVGIGTGPVDAETLKANLAKVFAVEGSAVLDPAGFSVEAVEKTVFDSPLSGRARFTVTRRPEAITDNAFYLRVRLK